MKPAELIWKIYGHTYDGLKHFYPYRQLLDQTAERLAVAPGEAVLDLGCGTGNLLEKLAGSPGVRLTGVDGSASMLGRARRKLAPQLRAGTAGLFQADVTAFLRTQPAGAFDKIVSTNVVYALADRQEFWTQLLRVLKPGGRAVIVTSVSTDSRPLIRQQLDHDGLLASLHPMLIGVFLCDAAINAFGQSGKFEFPNYDRLSREVADAGGSTGPAEPCYAGVDIMFDVRS